eukprot:4323606-Karenia_brevis.AAC.1
MENSGFRRQWNLVITKLRLHTHIYQLRHTGPSADALAGGRQVKHIMARGRWSTVQSVRRYSKPGGIQRALRRVPEPLLELGS